MITKLAAEPATKIDTATISMADNLTDETANAQTYYPNQNTAPYVGKIGNANLAFDKAVSLATGLTNDTTPTLNFALDKPLAADQAVEVVRYTIINGTRAAAETLQTQSTDKKSFSATDALPQTYGTNYEYVIRLKKDGAVVNEQTHSVRLDTLVEAMQVEQFNVNTNTNTATIVFKMNEQNSEINAKISVKYPVGGGRTQTADAVDTGNGTYTLTLNNYDRYNTKGIEMTVVDAAGNINTNRVVAIRNLFTALTTEKGPNATKAVSFDDGIVTWNNGSNDQGLNVVDAASGGLTMTDKNDTLIIGLDNFGAMGVGNGSIGDAKHYVVLGATPFNLDTGAGDDFVYVRGVAQNLGTNDRITMGEGNDKITFGGDLAFGKINLDMGTGHNTVEVLGGTGIAQAGHRTFTFADGNDSMFVRVNWDGAKTVNFGGGNDALHIGKHLRGRGTIDFGNGNDALIIGGDAGNPGELVASNTVNMGTGNDYIEIGGVSRRGVFNGDEGNDKVVLKGAIYDDSAHSVHQYNGGTNTDGSPENDILVIEGEDSYNALFFQNFETIDLTDAGRQTLVLTTQALLRDNTTETTIFGGAEDTVKLGGAGKWSASGASKVVDGVTVLEYTNNDNGVVSAEKLWIQDGITIA